MRRGQHAPPPPPDVVVADVLQKDVPIYVEWVGTTDGNVNAQIRARVHGYLQTRNYNEGTLVHAGDLMFAIDPRPYQAALDQAKGELGRAEAVLTKTQQDVTRYTPLAAEGAISQQELDNAVQAQRAAKAAVDSARAAVEKAQLDLDWTRVDLTDRRHRRHRRRPGRRPRSARTRVLTTVSQVDPIKVSFPISEQEYLRFARAIQCDKPRPGRASLELILADGSVYPERGTVSVANRQVDVKTGTMMIVALFPNPRNLLRPGQYAKVRATTETQTRRAPRAAARGAGAPGHLSGRGRRRRQQGRDAHASRPEPRVGNSVGDRRRPQAGRTRRRRGPTEGARRRDRQPEAGRRAEPPSRPPT